MKGVKERREKRKSCSFCEVIFFVEKKAKKLLVSREKIAYNVDELMNCVTVADFFSDV